MKKKRQKKPQTQNPQSEFQLEQLLEKAIAQRAEWRFLQQQRHLKDVLRLLARSLESSEFFTQEKVSLKAATHAWLSLLICQELELPPEQTRNAFLVSLIPDSLEKIVFFSETSALQVEKIVTFSRQIYRLQESIIGWNQPWYKLNRLISLQLEIEPHWILRIQEMMYLLERFDTLSFGLKTTESVNINQLHSSHPLKQQALKELTELQKKYINFIHPPKYSGVENIQFLFENIQTFKVS